MAEIKVRKITVRRKDGKPQRNLTARKVVINNQVQKLNAAAQARGNRR